LLIRGGFVERERNYTQVGVGGARELVDSGASRGKVRHHLGRHLGWIGRHALPRYPVIAGENEDLHALQARRRAALPVPKPSGKVFQAPQAARRLRQRRFARCYQRACRMITTRQVKAELAQL
jgi:hypothetical protein